MNSVVKSREYNKEVDNTQKNNPNENKETIRMTNTSGDIIEKTHVRKYNTVVYDA
jgi:hypothetical protein